MITAWVDGLSYEIPPDQVVPWICGIHGVLDTLDFHLDRPVTLDVDPSATGNKRSGVTYRVELGGVRYELAESWVLPWVRGMAVRHGLDDQILCDPGSAERAKCVQTLMAGHQLGLFVYDGFDYTREKHEHR